MKKQRNKSCRVNGSMPKILLKAKLLTFLMLIMSIASVTADSYSQQPKFSMNFEDISVREVFQKIEDNSEFIFIYSEKSVGLDRRVNVKVKDRPVSSVLDQVFKGTGNHYEIHDRQIAIMSTERRSKPVLSSSAIFKPDIDFLQKVISGKVKDSNGVPLPGVTISVKGSNQLTQTGADGNYSLTNVPDDAVLVFSFVGMKTQEISVAGRTTIDVVLEEAAIGLEEVVAIGYGTMKRSSLTGATAMMDVEKIQAFPSANIADAFQGKTAGVFVDPSELPGGGATIRIRGNRSLNATNSPLIIIDDVPAELSNLNAMDIASVEVLKDASATAIYGSRAANGVILITTKRAKKSGTTVEVNSYAGVNSYRFVQMQSKEEYVNFIKNVVYARNYGYTDVAAWQNSNLSTQDALELFSPTLAANYAAGNEFDWQSLMLDNLSPQTGQTISLNTKGEKSSSRLSYNYLYDKGYYKNNDFQKHILSYYFTHQATDWLKLGLDSRLGLRKNNLVPGGLWEFLIRMNPLEDPYNADGTLKETVGLEQYLNPLWTYRNGYFIDRDKDRNADVILKSDVRLTDKLRYNTNFKMGFGNSDRSWYYDRLSMPQLGGTSEAGINKAETFDYTWNNILTYVNDFGKHHFNVTAVQELQLYNNLTSRMSGQNIPMKDLAFYNLRTATDNLDLRSGYSKTTLSSFLGRVQYEFSDKYLFNVALRADGSSRLAEGNKWAYFPSASAAWRVTEEPFMKNLDWVSNLKLRVGYGEIGNQGISPYQTQILLQSGTYTWGNTGLLTWAPATLANKGLGWEISKTLNVGLEWGVWNNRLSGTVEVYRTQNKDLLLQRQLADITGFDSIWDNIGSTENKGFEVMLNSALIRNKDLNWGLNLNFSRNWNKITELPNGDDLGNQWLIGEPINIVYDFDYQGIWQIDELDEAKKYGRTPGEIKVLDNGDFDLNANDRLILGQRDPKWMSSLISDFRYKKLDFSFVINAMGGHLMSVNQIGGAAYNGEKWIISSMSDMWTPLNQDAFYPRPQQSARSHNQSQILSYMRGDHLKVQNMSLGYTFNKIMNRDLRTRLYLEARNAFYLYRAAAKDRAGGNQVNPEVGSIERTLPTTFVFGINLTL